MIKRRVSLFAIFSGILTFAIAFFLFQSDHLRVALETSSSLSKEEWSIPATTTTTTSSSSSSSSSTNITTTTTATALIEGNYYSDPLQTQQGLERHFQRGLNFLTCYSPCRMASWVFNGEKVRLLHREDCLQEGTPSIKYLNVSADVSKLEPKDTIYIQFLKLADFVNDFLPHLAVDVILMSGQQQITPFPLDPHLMKQVVDHPHVLRWFLHNLEMFGGEYNSHPKASIVVV
jgi:hypothetical protein